MVNLIVAGFYENLIKIKEGKSQNSIIKLSIPIRQAKLTNLKVKEKVIYFLLKTTHKKREILL